MLVVLQDAQASATGVLPGVRQHGAVSGRCMSRCICKGRCIFVREPVPRKERDWEKKPKYQKKALIASPANMLLAKTLLLIISGQLAVSWQLKGRLSLGDEMSGDCGCNDRLYHLKR